MAGAGYDISASLSQASTDTLALNYSSNVVFSGARLEGGNASSLQKEVADATSTNRSPGTVNSSQADLGGDDPAPAGGGKDNSKLILLAAGISVVLTLLTFLKK